MDGYAGKILRVDLSERRIQRQALDEEALRLYLGGAGLGGKILFDEVPPQTDAYSPKNKLLLMAGPLTGTEIPGAVISVIVTKSPIGGLPVVTSISGCIGRKLKFAGYDGFILEGAAKDWSYLLIEDDRVEVLDATDLLGKDVYETDDLLKKRHGASAVVGAIGPAGEKMVRFAGFLADKEHSASKGGTGAVLGSKKLKAIVVKSRNKGIPIHDEDLMAALIRKWCAIDDKVGLGPIASKRGIRGVYEAHYQRGIVPVKNLTENIFPEHEKLNYEAVSGRFDMRKGSCPGCNFNHFNRLLLGNEDLKEPHFDMLVGYGPNLGIVDPVEIVRLTTLADRLGLETQETAWMIGFLMECAEAGIIGPAQLDGIKLHWGDYEGAVDLMTKIARREGCGERFAEGIYQAARQLGPEALKRAVYTKRGFVPQVRDSRNDWAFAFAEAMSSVGHYEAQPNVGDLFSGGEEEGLAAPQAPDINPEDLPLHQLRSGARTQILDILGVCIAHGASGDIRLLSEALKAATGRELSPKELFQVGVRFINLMRLYAVRCGLKPEDDTLSPRYLSSPSWGKNVGKALAGQIEKTRRDYYRLMGWDGNGVPLPETLKELGIE